MDLPGERDVSKFAGVSGVVPCTGIGINGRCRRDWVVSTFMSRPEQSVQNVVCDTLLVTDSFSALHHLCDSEPFETGRGIDTNTE